MTDISNRLKSRAVINFLSRYYYRFMPSFIINSRTFHKILYRILIGKWFNVDFSNEFKKYKPKDWEKLYDSLFINRIRDDDLTDKQRELVLQHIKGPSVLEIGSGTGTILEKISERKDIVNVVGIDISPAVIKFLKQKFTDVQKIKLIQEDFSKGLFTQKFDTVLCLHVLEHIENHIQTVELIKKIAKRVILIVPNEYKHPYPTAYHLHFFNSTNPVVNLFKERDNKLELIDGDYFLVSDRISGPK